MKNPVKTDAEPTDLDKAHSTLTSLNKKIIELEKNINTLKYKAKIVSITEYVRIKTELSKNRQFKNFVVSKLKELDNLSKQYERTKLEKLASVIKISKEN